MCCIVAMMWHGLVILKFEIWQKSCVKMKVFANPMGQQFEWPLSTHTREFLFLATFSEVKMMRSFQFTHFAIGLF